MNLATYAGAGRYDYEMLCALQRQGHELLILLPQHSRGKEVVPPGCEVRWVAAYSKWHPQTASIFFFSAILSAAHVFKPAVIRVSNPYYHGLASLGVGWLLEIPTVASFLHSYETFRGSLWTERDLIREFTHVVTISEFSKKQLCGLNSDVLTKCTVIYAGVSRVFQPKQGDMTRWLLEHGVPVGEPVFASMGSLTPRKNHRWLVDLMASWVRAGNPGTLIIVGDGSERQVLEARIKEVGLARHVRLWGRVDDNTVVSLLQAADLFLFPSVLEGFGLAPAEALACGTPAIVSDRGSLPEVVLHGKTGFVIPIDQGFDPWLEAIHSVLSEPVRRLEMASAALADVHERFDWDRAASHFTAVCEKTVAESRFKSQHG